MHRVEVEGLIGDPLENGAAHLQAGVPTTSGGLHPHEGGAHGQIDSNLRVPTKQLACRTGIKTCRPPQDQPTARHTSTTVRPDPFQLGSNSATPCGQQSAARAPCLTQPIRAHNTKYIRPCMLAEAAQHTCSSVRHTARHVQQHEQPLRRQKHWAARRRMCLFGSFIPKDTTHTLEKQAKQRPLCCPHTHTRLAHNSCLSSPTFVANRESNPRQQKPNICNMCSSCARWFNKPASTKHTACCSSLSRAQAGRS